MDNRNPTPMKEWQIKKIDTFRAWLKNEDKNLNRLSQEQYCFQIQKFFRICNENKTTEINIEIIKKFLKTRREQKNEGNERVVYIRRFAMKKYLSFLKKGDLIAEVDKLKRQLRLQTRQYDRKMDFEIFKAMMDSFSAEMRCLLMVLYDTGMRISPMLNLKVKDLKIEEGGKMFLIGKEKGQKIVQRYLSEDCQKCLKLLLGEKYENKQFSNSFVFREDGETWRECYYRLWSELKIASRKFLNNDEQFGISFHWIRTNRARDLYQKYKDLLKVKVFLGHQNSSTTERYIDEGETKGNSEEIINNEKEKWGNSK